ncbi:MAG: aldo/keto reductase [Syntrophales bacterium]
MRLGLGSVQFGLDYGISNQDGRTPESEVKRILSVAVERGMSVIDTASQYGCSEETIGRCLPGDQPFRIVTKTPSCPKGVIADGAALLKDAFAASLRNLRQRTVYGLLIHDADDLLSRNGGVLWRALQDLKESGVVEKIGVSVYTPAQLDAVLRSFRIDLVQLPVNVADQRMIRSGHLGRLKDLGIEIHSRSAFLQGALLMDPLALPGHFSSIRGQLLRYRDFIRQHRMTPTEAALRFVLAIREIDTVVVGVNDSRQLRELCDVGGADSAFCRDDFASFSVDDEAVVNPCNWE